MTSLPMPFCCLTFPTYSKLVITLRPCPKQDQSYTVLPTKVSSTFFLLHRFVIISLARGQRGSGRVQQYCFHKQRLREQSRATAQHQSVIVINVQHLPFTNPSRSHPPPQAHKNSTPFIVDVIVQTQLAHSYTQQNRSTSTQTIHLVAAQIFPITYTHRSTLLHHHNVQARRPQPHGVSTAPGRSAKEKKKGAY